MAKTITHKINGQEYEVPEGYTKLDVMRVLSEQNKPKQLSPSLPVKSFNSQTKASKTSEPNEPGYFETGFPRGIIGSLKKSGAGLQEFFTGKPVEYEMRPVRQSFGDIVTERFGELAAHLGKTAAGATAGYKIAPFGPTGKAVGGLLGAFGAHYLTQPGARLGLERLGAAGAGLLEALTAGTGHPERIKLGKEIRAQEKIMPEYASKLLGQEQELEAAKEFTGLEKEKAIEQAGASTVGSLKRKRKLAQEKLAVLPSEQELRIKDISEERPGLPLLAPEKGMGAADIAKQQAETAETKLKEIFEPEEGGPTHQTNIHNLLKEDLAQKQSAYGQEYQNFRKKHADKVIKEGYVKDANQIIAELPDPTIMQLFGVGAESAEETASKVNRQLVPITKDVNTLFDNWRSLKRYSQRARGKARAKGAELSEDEKTSLTNAADRWDAAAAELAQVLKDNGYEESLNTLKDLNTRYANEYAPIYDTNAYWYMDKEGKAPPNFLDNIEGNTKGKKILQEAVKANPNIVKSALGQAVESNPKSALEGNKKALLNPYIKSHAESKPYFEQLNESLKRLPSAEKEQAELIKESIRIQNAGNEILKKIKLKKEASIEKQELDKVVANTDEYISRLSRAIINQKEKMRKVQMTKKQQIEAQKKLAQLESQREKLGAIKNGLGLSTAKYISSFLKTANKIIK